MMPGVLTKLLNRTPPAWLRKVEAAMLMGAFAKAFDVEAPATEDMSADEALAAFREFTAACMEAALADADVAALYRARLGEEARELGRKVRAAAPASVRSEHAFDLVRFFYRGIGIELSGELPADRSSDSPLDLPAEPPINQPINVRFGPCSFAQRYTPADCWFMSAFDEGFICGVLGVEDELRFDCRLTEGAACCCARLG